MTKNAPDISIVYRALNEEKWFRDSLVALHAQVLDESVEIVLVDSGSTDLTLNIAKEFECRITHIKKADFSFGRSLNQGCDHARGNILVFISAHCIPDNPNWLKNLIAPIQNKQAVYTYGRQIGHDLSAFSEKQIFSKYFPNRSAIPQDGFFCNNANSAITREAWRKYKFDELVTGLEDMVLAKQLYADGEKIAYVAEATVIHIHEETREQTKNRYYREALTLRDIMPEVQINFSDFVRYLSAGILLDFSVALEKNKFWAYFWSIVRFRHAQYWGTYKGHHESKKLSQEQKERYYYPKNNDKP